MHSADHAYCCTELIRAENRKYLTSFDHDNTHYINAHINNISFPTSIDELEYYIYERRMFDVEDILTNSDSGWTVPRNAKIGDIVLFFHAKTAISRITALITQVNNLPANTRHDTGLLLEWLDKAKRIYKIIGGKIFAIARVSGSPEYWPLDNEFNQLHWRGRVFADVSDITVLKQPIDISEFNSFIKVSRQSAITPLPRNEFNQLRTIILNQNDNLPPFFHTSEIGDYALSHITAHNFLDITQEYRRRFLLEIDFRSYYVNYVLKSLFGHKFWSECICHTEGKPNYYVDNVFYWKGKYYLLEVKLNVLLEPNLPQQLQQYIFADDLCLSPKFPEPVSDFERQFMFVIDTNKFYRYDVESDTLCELVDLDAINRIDDFTCYLP